MWVTSSKMRIQLWVVLALTGFLLLFASTAYATTVTVLDGKVSITDSANKNTLSGGVVTITATGGWFASTNNITITNSSDATATLMFDYSVSNYQSFTIAGNSAAAGGTYSTMLNAGASISLSLTSKTAFTSTTATLELSNFSLTVAAASSNVTIEYDSELGSVTAGGSTVASGTIQNASLADGVALVATAKSGATFLGWVDASSGAVLSSATSYTLIPTGDMTVKAVFIGANSTPWFGVSGATQSSASSGLLGLSKIYYYTVSTSYVYLFDDLNKAATAAQNSTSKYIVLLNSGTLGAGTYTIPAGVTLLIPFDDSNTMFTTQPLHNDGWTKPTAFRTLTLANGANITLNGSMSISAKHSFAKGKDHIVAAPTGACGFVEMQGNSNITVNNGGALYAYGFVTGSGSVTANSGATVYELFQFNDFRGGTQSTSMENEVFPFSQYYVQNIEVPLTLHSGAQEYAYTTIYMSSADFGTAVKFVGPSDSMFNITSGYAVKRYDGSTDRLHIDVYGNGSIANVELTFGTTSIDSGSYDLPLNSNITVHVHSGSATINQDLALLPGSQVIVDNGATVTLSSSINIYAYDADQWGNYCGISNNKMIPVKYAPGKTYTRTEADLIDAKIVVNGTLDASAGYLYTTAGGANICSTGTGVVKATAGTQTVTYQLVQNTGYTEIPITPAKLQHGDGSYLTSGTNTYTYSGTGINGRWVCATHTEVIDPAVAPTCSSTGLSEGKHCSVCGTVTVAQTVVPASSHSYTSEVTAPTCTAEGYTTYTCTVCGHSYTGDKVAATGHTPGAVANCTTAQTCMVCGEVVTAALGHNWTPATCTAPKTCTVCGATEGSAASHSYDNGVITTDPTCTTEGVKTFTCSACGGTKTESVAAMGHSWTEATCTNPKTCSVCGATEGTAAGHKWNEATCTNPKTCTVCGATEGTATGHNYTSEITTPATCTTAGVETFTCSACGDSYTKVIPAGHTYGANGICSCGWFKFLASNVRLGNNLDMMFAFPQFVGNAEPNACYVEIKREGVVVDTIYYSQWRETSVNGQACYYVIYSGFAAKDMIDSVEVCVYNGNKEPLCDPWTDSIRAYCDRMLITAQANDDEVLETLLADMLNYGAACQTFFNYKTGTLANAGFEGTGSTAAFTEPTNCYTPSNTYFFGDNLIPDCNSQFVVGFTSDIKNIENLTITYSFTNHWKIDVKRTVSFKELGHATQSGTEFYYLSLLNLRIADAHQKITISFLDGETTVSWEDSVESYCWRMITKANAVLDNESTSEGDKTNATNTINVMTAFMRFSDSAYTYLHAKEVTNNENISGT